MMLIKRTIRKSEFFDRYSEVGRYVYDLAFQRFVMERSKGFDKTKNNRYYLAILSSEYVLMVNMMSMEKQFIQLK